MSENGDQPTLAELHAENRPPETKPVAVRLPKPLLGDLDDIWEEGACATRSEFIRSVLEHVAENPTEFDSLGLGNESDVRQPRQFDE